MTAAAEMQRVQHYEDCEEEHTPDAPGPEHSYVSMKNDASVVLPLASTRSADGK